MPVATLRNWERRYGVGGTATAGGHRRYGAAELRRLELLRHLSQAGHAIGSIAHLDEAALRGLQAASADALPADAANWVVVGDALAARIAQHAPPAWAGAQRHASIEAWLAAPAEPAAALLAAVPTLDDDAWQAVQAAAAARGVARIALAYAFATTATLRDCHARGVLLVREPLDDTRLTGWLAQLQPAAAADMPPGPGKGAHAAAAEAIAPLPIDPPPPRFSPGQLVALAARQAVTACECPRHVAELVQQLGSFERYSARCALRHAADASLHRLLQHSAGQARALMERALDAVARHEGWPADALPAVNEATPR